MKSERRNELPGFLQLLGKTREIYRKRFGTVVGIFGITCVVGTVDGSGPAGRARAAWDYGMVKATSKITLTEKLIFDTLK